MSSLGATAHDVVEFRVWAPNAHRVVLRVLGHGDFPMQRAEGGMFDDDTVKTMTGLIKKGTFGAAVFTCNDLMATYEELKTKGVVFKKPPTKEFYGYEALFVDDSGNWFRSYGNENWEFDDNGLMRLRFASINDLPIKESERKYHWPLGRRPDEHPELSDLSL